MASTHGTGVSRRHGAGGANRRSHGPSFVGPPRAGDAYYGNGQVVLEQVPPGGLPPGSVDSGVIQDESLILSKFTLAIRPPVIVDSLPVLPDLAFPDFSTVVLTTDGKLYRNDGGAWTTAVETVDLSGVVSVFQLHSLVQGALADDPMNMAVNGGGEQGTLGAQATGWTYGGGNPLIVAEDGQRYGARSLKFNNTVATDSFSYQAFVVAADVIYVCSGWISTNALPVADAGWGAVINTDSISAGAVTVLETVGASPSAGDVGLAADGVGYPWTFVKMRLKWASAGAVRVYLQLGQGAQSGQAWFDGFRFARESKVVSDDIVSGAITTEKMTANTINGDRISGETLHGGKIIGGSIAADRVEANSLTAGQISAGAIGASEILAGAVQTDKLAAGAVSADKVSVGVREGGSLVPNSSFEDGIIDGATEQWTYSVLGGGLAFNHTSFAVDGSRGLVLYSSAGAGKHAIANCAPFPVRAGEQLYAQVSLYPVQTATDCTSFSLAFYDAADAFVSQVYIVDRGDGVAGVRQSLTGYATVPATAVSCRVFLRNIEPNGGIEVYLVYDQCIVERMAGGLRNSTAETIINAAGITVTNGKITVINAAGTVVIDGTSNMFKIAATGTHATSSFSNPANPGSTVTTTLSTGFTYVPANLIYAVFASSTVAYLTPYAVISIVAGPGSALDWFDGNTQLFDTNKTKVNSSVASARQSGTTVAYTFRYYVLKEAVI